MAILAALVLASLAGAAEHVRLRVATLLEWLAALVCVALGVVGVVGGILAASDGDMQRAGAFLALFAVAMLLLAGLVVRANVDGDDDRRDSAPAAAVPASAGSSGIAVIVCTAGAIAGAAGAMVSALYGHPLRALGFAVLPLVAGGVLAALALRGSDNGDRR